MQRVMEVEADGVANQKALIALVWGPEYTDGRKFMDIAQPQLMQIRKAIAQAVSTMKEQRIMALTIDTEVREAVIEHFVAQMIQSSRSRAGAYHPTAY